MRKNYLPLSDADLIDCIRLDEDALAFAELYRRYAKALYHLSYGKVGTKQMAEEIVQITFLKLWAARKELRISYSLKAYLYKATKNNIISYYAKHLPDAIPLQDCAEESLPNGHYTQEQIDQAQLVKFYEEALAALPDKCREVFCMSRMGYSMKEIGKAHKISPKTVEVHIGKALRMLRDKFKNGLLIFLLAALSFFFPSV